MTEQSAAIHAVETTPEPKRQARGITTEFVARSAGGDYRWLPFPGLEDQGAEVLITSQESREYLRWRKKVTERYKNRAKGTVDMDVWNAKLPEGYARHIVKAWRTRLDDGSYVDGVAWGGDPTITADVYRAKGRGAILREEELTFDVDADGYLRSTEDNRLKLFAAFSRVFDGVLALSTDDAVFARPDEDAIQGN